MRIGLSEINERLGDPHFYAASEAYYAITFASDKATGRVAQSAVAKRIKKVVGAGGMSALRMGFASTMAYELVNGFDALRRGDLSHLTSLETQAGIAGGAASWVAASRTQDALTKRASESRLADRSSKNSFQGAPYFF